MSGDFFPFLKQKLLYQKVLFLSLGAEPVRVTADVTPGDQQEEEAAASGLLHRLGTQEEPFSFFLLLLPRVFNECVLVILQPFVYY